MKFYFKTDKGWVCNVPKVEALLEKVNPDVIVRAVGTRECLPTVKHGSNLLFVHFTTLPTTKEKAEAYNADLLDLASAANFKGIKARLATIKLACILAFS